MAAAGGLNRGTSVANCPGVKVLFFAWVALAAMLLVVSGLTHAATVPAGPQTHHAERR